MVLAPHVPDPAEVFIKLSTPILPSPYKGEGDTGFRGNDSLKEYLFTPFGTMRHPQMGYLILFVFPRRKADGPLFLRFGWSHQFANSINQVGDGLIMPGDLALQFIQLLGNFFVCCR